MPEQNDPFFVIGTARSGTTMLRLMLNMHSRLRLPRESWFIADLMNELPIDSPLGAEQLERAVRIICDHPRWKVWEIAEPAVRQTVLALDGPLLSELVDAIFRSLGNPLQKPRWGDKTPGYVRDVPRLHGLFPRAKFVHIIRDGRDVALSLRQRGWDGVTSYDFAENWHRDVGMGVRDGRALGPALYMEVSYEQLVLNTEPALRRICAFLGETFEEPMLRFFENAAEEMPAWEAQYHEKTRRAPQEGDVNRWMREMSGLHVAIFECVAGRTMDLVGYPRRFRGLSRQVTATFAALMFLLNVSRRLRHRLGIEAPRLRKRL